MERLLRDRSYLDRRIRFCKTKGIILTLEPSPSLTRGHLERAGRNLDFVRDNLKLGYLDWCVTGCYYAIYHAALALLAVRGFVSTNHDATLCLLVKEYVVGSDALLDAKDVALYATCKLERELASYSSEYQLSKRKVEELRFKAALFIRKARGIVRRIS